MFCVASLREFNSYIPEIFWSCYQNTNSLFQCHDCVILSTRNSPFSCMQLQYPITKSTWNLNDWNYMQLWVAMGSQFQPWTNTKFVSQPSKRLRPCSDSDVSQNHTQDLQELSDLLDNLSKNEELVEQAASLILNKPALRNAILNI